jgi:trans-aconitate 2-methyltransferase
MAAEPRDGPDGVAIRDYYDEFRDQRMVAYRSEGNLRIDRAAERIVPYVGPDSRVLEIGCGIGIVTERIAKQVRTGQIWACDISPKNIEYAARTVRSRHIDFFIGDVLADYAAIVDRVGGAVDIVALVDVLEHLPLSTHDQLFTNLRVLMGPNAFLILTYPSPQYQRYLRDCEPQELQIIDEVVELEHLLKVATTAGFSLRHFSLEDVWRRNQYVHCVFQTSATVERLVRAAPTGIRRMLQRVRSVANRRLLRPVRQRSSRSVPGPGTSDNDSPLN